MTGTLHWLGALCSVDVGARSALPAGLFVAGVLGSLGHCVPMCGGFVLARTADVLARVPIARLCEWRRISGGLLLPYHLGRLTTYAGLGAAAAGSAAVLGRVSWFADLSSALLTLAALLFLGSALRRLLPGIHRPHPPRLWGQILRRVTRRIPRGSALGTFLLGLTLGFLPCGFLYAALTAAAATGDPLLGAGAMLAFGLGTVPSLMAVGIGGQSLGRRWQTAITVAAPFLMTANALLLLLIAWR